MLGQAKARERKCKDRQRMLALSLLLSIHGLADVVTLKQGHWRRTGTPELTTEPSVMRFGLLSRSLLLP